MSLFYNLFALVAVTASLAFTPTQTTAGAQSVVVHPEARTPIGIISYYDDSNGLSRVAGFHSILTEINTSEHEIAGLGTVYSFRVTPGFSTDLAQYVFTVDCHSSGQDHYYLGYVIFSPGNQVRIGRRYSTKGPDRDDIPYNLTPNVQYEPWYLFQDADAHMDIGIPCPGKNFASLGDILAEAEGTMVTTIPTE